MKNHKLKSLLLMMILFGAVSLRAQNTFPSTGRGGIYTTTPNSSAALDIDTIGKGLLIPRMTKMQRDAIASPATSLLIYQTNNTPGFYYYNGSAWTAVSSKGANKSLSNLTAPTSVNVDLLPTGSSIQSLGSATLPWNDLYLGGKLYLDGNIFLDNSGGGNIWIGHTANTTNTGTYNTAVGDSALHSNTIGLYNTANGANALYSNINGYYNTANGAFALFSTINGSFNTANGPLALYANTSGSHNSANGPLALRYNTTGSYNIANGEQALCYNTTGFYNTATGFEALTQNTTGASNTATGINALRSNTTGSYNTANGSSALYFNTTGSHSIAIGNAAMQTAQQNSFNVAIGDSSLYNYDHGTFNDYMVALGYKALQKTTTGFFNTAIGGNAAQNVTTGSGNVAVGTGALSVLTTGTSNTAVGYNADVSANNQVNSTAFGYSTVVNASNKIRFGNAAVTVIEGTVAYTVSDARFKSKVTEDVKGLEFINQLRPVVYNFEAKKFDEFLNKNKPGVKDERMNPVDYSGAESIRYSGFLAQEVEQAANKVGYDFNGVHVPESENDNYSLAYSEFVVPLVKAVQELSKTNDELSAGLLAEKNENEKLQLKNQELENRFSKIETMLGVNDEGKVSSTENETVLLEGNTGYSLGQNVPNPFMSKTTIPYSLPSTISSASIVFQNEHGVVLKTNELKPGSGTVEVETRDLASGVYQYSLIIDGRIVSTKQMELLK